MANTPTSAAAMTNVEIDDLWIRRPNLHSGVLMLQLRDFARAVLAKATPAVPGGWRLLKDSTHEERCWPEDYAHENGSYFCSCCECGRQFQGHKRRVVCKVCANGGNNLAVPPPAEVEAAQAQPASAPTVQPSEACPRGDQRPEPTCTNRHQCWEPCGELGHSMEHARLSLTTPEEVDRILGISRAPEAAGEQPVAWRYMRAGGEFFYTDYHDPDDPDCERGQPLYTAPAQVRMPLSEEDRHTLMVAAECLRDTQRARAGVMFDLASRLDAIRAAHGIQGESGGAAPGVHQPDGAKR